jgi:hypothetical protein
LEGDGWEIRNYSSRAAALPAMARYLLACDLAFTWGGRVTLGKFLAAARWLGKQNVVILWCGSDTLEARADFRKGRVEKWIASRTHWAGAPWLAEEVRQMGLPCEYVPVTWVRAVSNVPPLPAKFSVLAYLPDAARVNLYGIDHVLELARQLPDVQFTVVGLQPGQRLPAPDNVSVHGWAPSLVPYYLNATVLWRPVRHDGLSFTALEALGHGRHVLWSYPFGGSIVAPDAAAARVEIERLRDLHESGNLDVNHAGARFVAENFAPEKIREGILGRWQRIIGVATLPAAEPSAQAGERSLRSQER